MNLKTRNNYTQFPINIKLHLAFTYRNGPLSDDAIANMYIMHFRCSRKQKPQPVTNLRFNANVNTGKNSANHKQNTSCIRQRNVHRVREKSIGCIEPSPRAHKTKSSAARNCRVFRKYVKNLRVAICVSAYEDCRAGKFD